MVYVKSIISLKCIESAEIIYVTAYARETIERKKFDAPQLTGSSMSYSNKYALSNMFLLDDIKDSDSQDNTNELKNYIYPHFQFYTNANK